ncbi:MAG: hypothetical protein F2766_05210 [Actinobacteria bacterium]|uniref:Unannotated protein n=1 Tax=freshwater metagenome TaxID=449393 RepID=A0A6J6VQ96_9ZZZZ|nr:hypothetical protein [Actinomycetota bacterium]MSY35420.1 hypothetical protein [Actinomycetota bacterium]
MGIYDFMHYAQERQKWLKRAEDPLLAPAERAVFIAMAELIAAQRNLESAKVEERIYLRERRKK